MLCVLAMVRALLEGGKLFHHFTVNRQAQRVIYLIPEGGLGPRLKTFTYCGANYTPACARISLDAFLECM